MRCAAVNSGTDFHLLDHIAPLADLIQMPLITTEELNYTLALRSYPQVETKYIPDLEFKLSYLAEQFDVLFECKYWTFHLKKLFRDLYNKEMRLVFCPHGQSDKGFQEPLLAPYATQDAVLIYGELMMQMLKELGVWSSISHYEVLGNYRLAFYEKYRSFYDHLVEKEFPLNPNNKTLLYAPTWRDADQSTSFFNHGSKVISQLPTGWNLILKLHPLLEQRDPALFYSMNLLANKNPNIFVISEFPPIYPLLARTDIYLGDASSIGYDFLFFKKPLYFFPTSYRGWLASCGVAIDPQKNIYSQIENVNLYSKQQEALYRLAFGWIKDREAIPLGLDFLNGSKAY